MKKILLLGASSLTITIARQIEKDNDLLLLGIIGNLDLVDGELKKFYLGKDINLIYTINPDITIAIDFDKILGSEIINSFTIINSHGSILPDYKGMHSLGWAFINGESEVGYTIHIINEFLDEGPILFQDKFKIGKTTTFNNIKDNIIESIEFNLLKVVKGYLNHSIIPVPQTNNSGIRYVAKRNIADCYIDFKWSTEFIDRFIRALSPPKGPGAFTVFKNKKLIILEVEKYECSPYFEVPGHILLRDKNKILVKTGDGCIWIKKVEYESNSANASEIITSQGLRLGINLLDEKLKDLGII